MKTDGPLTVHSAARHTNNSRGPFGPAQLAKGSDALHAYLSNRVTEDSSAAAPDPWTSDSDKVTTPFVSVPGLLSAQCVSNDRGSYLEVTVHGDPDDPRTDAIAGDVMTDGEINAGWGLHLIDANLATGDLVAVVGKQAKTYLAR